MRSVSLLRYRCGIFFSLSPDPLSPALSNLLASACSPAPGRGRRGRLGFAAAGVAAICLLASFLCRSLAHARSLLPHGSPCGVVLLGCPVDAVPSSPSPACSSLAGGCGGAWFCVPLSSSISDPPRFPFPVPPSCPPDGEGMAWCCRLLACLLVSSGLLRCARAGVRFLFLCRVRCRDVCGELTGTARVPMIGYMRFPFSRHLVLDTG